MYKWRIKIMKKYLFNIYFESSSELPTKNVVASNFREVYETLTEKEKESIINVYNTSVEVI